MHIMDNTNAMMGVKGYRGTKNGLFKWGSDLRNLSKASIETIYKVRAPKTEMIMISPVLPVHKMIIPRVALKSNAFAGV